MSKRKLRKQGKIFSTKLENRCWYVLHWFEKPKRIITSFNCENNFIYLNAIANYSLIKAFKIHELWVRHIDVDTSCLVCEFNKDKRVIHDLSPFWDIFNLIKSGNADNDSLISLIRKIENEYDFSVPLTYKDKYEVYRKNRKKSARF
ncbi:hypothetical protein [Aliarcobacter butzleri]|uniref:hypothetical protein n=1 Tax=Aliarcobacter butzleri TaxID=28197 RepID=UPI00126A5F23|nr:hypothetical protein [Aliarcobacter butzleri]